MDLLYEYRDVFDVDNPPKNPIPNFSYKFPLEDGTPVLHHFVSCVDL